MSAQWWQEVPQERVLEAVASTRALCLAAYSNMVASMWNIQRERAPALVSEAAMGEDWAWCEVALDVAQAVAAADHRRQEAAAQAWRDSAKGQRVAKARSGLRAQHMARVRAGRLTTKQEVAKLRQRRLHQMRAISA